MTPTETTATRQRRTKLWYALPAAVPFVISAAGVRLGVPRVADSVVRKVETLVAIAQAIRPIAVPAAPEVAVPSLPAPPARRLPVGAVLRAAAPAARSVRTVARPDSPRACLTIGADRALELVPKLGSVRAATAMDPQGQPVGASLSGVACLGVGFEEGDVVTRVAGRSTPTAEDALAAAMGAYASGAREVRGTIVRRGDPIDVTVAIPVLPGAR